MQLVPADRRFPQPYGQPHTPRETPVTPVIPGVRMVGGTRRSIKGADRLKVRDALRFSVEGCGGVDLVSDRGSGLRPPCVRNMWCFA